MDGDDETNFPHKLLLTNKQIKNLRKAFANNLSTDIKVSTTQLSKMVQLGGFLGRLLGLLLKTGLPLKAHRQISKKRCFEKYYPYDQACQFSALYDTP